MNLQNNTQSKIHELNPSELAKGTEVKSPISGEKTIAFDETFKDMQRY